LAFPPIRRRDRGEGGRLLRPLGRRESYPSCNYGVALSG
jgi:hypothetical protein